MVKQTDAQQMLGIPKSLADDAKLGVNSEVVLSIRDGELMVSRAVQTSHPTPKYKFDDLLAGITPENLHEETDWGPAVGNEVW
jgi:antitoxin MazE